jgi:hypothetical protein
MHPTCIQPRALQIPGEESEEDHNLKSTAPPFSYQRLIGRSFSPTSNRPRSGSKLKVFYFCPLLGKKSARYDLAQLNHNYNLRLPKYPFPRARPCSRHTEDLWRRVVFVLKETSPEKWISNGATDFAIQLKPPDFSDVSGKVLEAESSYSNWSLFDRFCLANEVLDASDSSGIPDLCPSFLLNMAFWMDIFVNYLVFSVPPSPVDCKNR